MANTLFLLWSFYILTVHVSVSHLKLLYNTSLWLKMESRNVMRTDKTIITKQKRDKNILFGLNHCYILCNRTWTLRILICRVNIHTIKLSIFQSSFVSQGVKVQTQCNCYSQDKVGATGKLQYWVRNSKCHIYTSFEKWKCGNAGNV